MFQGKFLVTGATGDTGRATIDELLARGHQVRALAHSQDDRSKKLQERGVEVVFGDLLDFGQVRSALNGVGRAYFAPASSKTRCLTKAESTRSSGRRNTPTRRLLSS